MKSFSDNIELALVADIGGTNTRFGLAKRPTPAGIQEDIGGSNEKQFTEQGVADYILLTETLWVVPTRSVVGVEHALSTYLHLQRVGKVSRACLVVAGPADPHGINMTNGHWQVTFAGIRKILGTDDVILVNDFVGQCAAMVSLPESNFEILVNAPGMSDCPRIVVGVGTGLGFGVLVPLATGWKILPTEGGHTGFAVQDQLDWAIQQFLKSKYGGRVFTERVLSGQGLIDVFHAVCFNDGLEPCFSLPADFTAALANPGVVSTPYQHCMHVALQRFFGCLGAYCGDMVLATGGRGGVYLCSGVLLHLQKYLLQSTFMDRFLDKGAYQSYMAGVPVRLCTEPRAGLLGAVKLLGDTFT